MKKGRRMAEGGTEGGRDGNEYIFMRNGDGRRRYG